MITELLLAAETSVLAVGAGFVVARERTIRRGRRRDAARIARLTRERDVATRVSRVNGVVSTATGSFQTLEAAAEQARQITPAANDTIDAIVELTRERTISLIRAFEKEQI